MSSRACLLKGRQVYQRSWVFFSFFAVAHSRNLTTMLLDWIFDNVWKQQHLPLFVNSAERLDDSRLIPLPRKQPVTNSAGYGVAGYTRRCKKTSDGKWSVRGTGTKDPKWGSLLEPMLAGCQNPEVILCGLLGLAISLQSIIKELPGALSQSRRDIDDFLNSLLLFFLFACLKFFKQISILIGGMRIEQWIRIFTCGRDIFCFALIWPFAVDWAKNIKYLSCLSIFSTYLLANQVTQSFVSRSVQYMHTISHIYFFTKPPDRHVGLFETCDCYSTYFILYIYSIDALTEPPIHLSIYSVGHYCHQLTSLFRNSDLFRNSTINTFPTDVLYNPQYFLPLAHLLPKSPIVYRNCSRAINYFLTIKHA